MTQAASAASLATFDTFLNTLPADFQPPTVNGVPLMDYVNQVTSSGTALEVNSSEIAVELPGSTTTIFGIITGSGLGVTSSDQLLGTLHTMQIYSGGYFSGGTVLGGTLLGEVTAGSTTYTLMEGNESVTLSGPSLPTSFATLYAILSYTYSGPNIVLTKEVYSENGQTITYALSGSSVTLTAGAYKIAFSGSFSDSFGPADVENLFGGDGLGSAGPIGYVTGVTVTLSATGQTIESATSLVRGGLSYTLGQLAGVLTQANTSGAFDNLLLQIAGGYFSDDFNMDGRSDLLLQNTNGAVVVGDLKSGTTESFSQIASLGPEWKIVGTGDFLGDSKADVLIENTSGAVVVAEYPAGQMNFTQVTSLSAAWRFVGDGDFLGDGRTDFLIQNTAGAVSIGEVVNGTVHLTSVTSLGPEWKFVGTGDFLGHGHSGFLIENSAGAVVVGEMSGASVAFTQVAALGPEWKFVETADFLGDGRSDFLIENSVGALAVGEVVSGHATYTAVGGLGSEWRFVGAGDYAGTGKDSFVIESTSGAVFTGTVVSGHAQYAQITALGSAWTFHG